MGYRVEYGNFDFTRKKEMSNIRRFWMCALCFAIFLVMVSACWPGGREVLANVFLPDRNLWTAAESLADNLRYGADLSDCVAVFCRELLGKNANLS